MSDLDAQTAIDTGGWDPRFARVLDLRTEGDWSAALVDTNGDRAELSVDLYQRGPGGRWALVSSGSGTLEHDGLLATWDHRDRLVLTRSR